MDKELLFRPRLPEDDVEIPGVGTVRVRGLSRLEAMSVRGVEDRAKAEQKILSLAMLDPTLTEAEVARWQQASDAMEIEAITDKVTELSGMSAGAAKEVVKEFEANPDAEFRAVPSPEAVDAGGGPAGADG